MHGGAHDGLTSRSGPWPFPNFLLPLRHLVHSPDSDDGLYTEPVEIVHMPHVSTVSATAGLTLLHTTGGS